MPRLCRLPKDQHLPYTTWRRRKPPTPGPAAGKPCGSTAPPPHVARAHWLWQGSGNNFRLTNLNARMRK